MTNGQTMLDGQKTLTWCLNHARRHRVVENLGEVIHKSANDNCLIPQPSRRSFCHYRITDWSRCDHIAKCRHDQENTNSHVSMFAMRESQAADCKQTKEHKCETSHVNGCSSKMWEQKPTDNSADYVACRKRDVQVKSLDFGKPCCFEKGDRVS